MAGFTNPFARNRLQSIMRQGQSSPTFRSSFSNPMMDDPDQDEASKYYTEMEKIRANSGPGLSAYKQELQNMPTPEQYKPSVGRKLGAALIGGLSGFAGDPNAYENAIGVRDKPYNQAMQQYGLKLSGLKEQAGMEQDEMNAQLRAISQARALGLKYDEFEFKKLESGKKAETDRLTAQATMERAKAYADNMRKPGYDTFPQADGSVLYQNKNDKSDNFIVKGETVAAAQLKISGRNADSQRMSAGAAVSNAATSSRNADINAQRAKDYSRNTESLIKSRGGEGGKVEPNVLKAARDLAISEMQMIPEYSKFARTDEYGDPLDPADLDDEDKENYSDFLMMLEKRIKDILRRQR